MIEIDKKTMDALDKAISLEGAFEPLKDLRAKCVAQREKTLQDKLDALEFKGHCSCRMTFADTGSMAVNLKQTAHKRGFNWMAPGLRELSAHLIKVAEVLEQHGK